MKKKIGIVCDNYKANKYRKRFLKEGYTFEYDKPSIRDTHLFRIEVDEKNYNKEKNKIEKILTQLEFEIKNSN